VSKEGVNMATRHFENASLATLSDSILSSSLLMDGFPAPLRLTHVEQPGTEMHEGAIPPPAAVEFSNIGKCVRWAFAIEGGVAVLAYTIWVLLHHWK
jgi:hypothetical protein